jgi:hypothetical protein
VRFEEGYCPCCKHELQMDTTQNMLTCPFCGTYYNVENALFDKAIIYKEKIKEEAETEKIKHEEQELLKNFKGNVKILIFYVGLLMVFLFFMWKIGMNEINETSIIVETEVGTESNKSIDEVTVEKESLDGETLPGSKIQIKDNDKIIDEWTSNSESEISLGNINTPEGYELVETDANEQSEITEMITFMISVSIQIMSIMGCISLSYSTLGLIIAFRNEDQEAKSRSLMTIITSVLLLSTKLIYSMITA